MNLLITDLLKKENVKLQVDANTWEEAGRAAGALLVNNGGVEPKYIDAMIESVKKFGPYIVIAPNIAIFHARPQDGVKKICMSLVTLKSGVNFNAGDKDPVSLIFAFGALDHKTHLEALAELMVILQDKNTLRSILNSRKEGEVLEIIRKKLENN